MYFHNYLLYNKRTVRIGPRKLINDHTRICGLKRITLLVVFSRSEMIFNDYSVIFYGPLYAKFSVPRAPAKVSGALLASNMRDK